MSGAIVMRVTASLVVFLWIALASPSTAATTGYVALDPATWTNKQLAAQLTFSCVAANDLDGARRHAAAGIGGITLLGNRAPRNLRRGLAAAGAAAPHGVRPFIASDEEGGAVQRLRYRIYRLPSAETMGSWRSARVRAVARDYGKRMRELGVTMNFAPVADLGIRGYYIDSLQRAFSANPYVVSRKAHAFRLGLEDARVVPVVKHWPGHGQARDSHTGVVRVPALSVLEQRDMIPFNREFARGAPVVMVGHLRSTGLTERGVPVSQSRRALRYLRAKTGPQTVIVTDSLTMAAASSALGISTTTAAVRALRAGADWALACSEPASVVAAIRSALSDGRLSRARAEASARRILALKARHGLIAR